MKIVLKDSTMVCPAQDTPNRRIWLSNLDLMHGRNHLPTVYLYEPNGSSSFFDAKLLKEALSKVLVPFYPAAGRLARDEKGRIEINCNGEGVLFVEAETDSSASDLGDFKPDSELLLFVPKVDYSKDMSCDPLVILQVTKFSCGRVCLGVGFNHTLADGEGALHFINSWSNAARALSVNATPYLERTILRARDPPTSKFQHIEYDPPPAIVNTTNAESRPSQANSVVLLEIPLDQINALKAKVNNEGSKLNYSTYEILSAHIWRSTCKARCLCGDQSTKLYIPVDGRSRLCPPVPPGYFGNVAFRAATIALSGELLSEPLVRTVERIHEAINRMDEKYLRSAIDYLEDPGENEVATLVTKIFRCPNLGIISWMRLPFECADFGWGRPAFLRPTNLNEGRANILPSFNNDGNLSLAICLQDHHMKAFEKLFYALE